MERQERKTQPQRHSLNFVTKEECRAFQRTAEAKREVIVEKIEGIRREQRLGFALVTIFISIIGLLIKTGVI